MKLRFLTVISLLVLLLTTSVSAATLPCVTDNANLFSADEEISLNEIATDMSAQIGGDVVIFTSMESYSGSRDFMVEEFYAESGFSPNGVVLHIDMCNSEVWVQTFGALDDTLATADKDELYYQVRDFLSDGDFYGGATHYIETLPVALDGTIRYGLSLVELIVIVPISILLFCGIFFGVTLCYNSEGKEKPYPFQERATTRLTTSHDNFVREYVTSVRIIKDNDNNSAGHSSGGSSSSSGGRF